MSKGRTLAFQVSEEFFQRIKDYLARYEEVYGRKLSQRQFVIELIEQALEEADEEFEAARSDEDESYNDDQLEEEQPEDGDPTEYESNDDGQEADEADDEPDNEPSEEA